MSPGRQLGILWGGVAAAIVALSPFASDVAARLWSCPFKTVTTVGCPGCGTTRAALALGRLDVLGALALNPLMTLGLIFLVGGGLVAGVAALLGHGVPSLRMPLHPALRYAAIVILTANWAYLIWAGI